jgi:hypothetical protein
VKHDQEKLTKRQPENIDQETPTLFRRVNGARKRRDLSLLSGDRIVSSARRCEPELSLHNER